MEIQSNIINKDIYDFLHIDICKYICKQKYKEIKEIGDIIIYMDENNNINDNDISLYYCLYLCIACNINDNILIELILNLFNHKIHDSYECMPIFSNKYYKVFNELTNILKKHDIGIDNTFIYNFENLSIYDCYDELIDNENIDGIKLLCDNKLLKFVKKDCIINLVNNITNKEIKDIFNTYYEEKY